MKTDFVRQIETDESVKSSISADMTDLPDEKMVTIDAEEAKEAVTETKSDEDLKNGLSKLHAVSHKDLNDVTSHVQKVGKQIEEKKRQSAIKSNLPMSSRFKNTVILGDSLSEAFLDYRLLPQNIVLASRGKRTDNCDTEIQSAISLSPDKVFLSFGMNDLLYCRGNAQRFINQYKKLVTTIQKQLPDTKIYINSIIPMNENGYATDNNMRKDKAFNTALKIYV